MSTIYRFEVLSPFIDGNLLWYGDGRLGGNCIPKVNTRVKPSISFDPNMLPAKEYYVILSRIV